MNAVMELRDEEKAIYDACDIEKYGLTIEINPRCPVLQQPCALDVEHDEQGGLVGVGVYDGTRSYYWTDLATFRHLCPDLEIIAHNGRGDIDCLRFWGCNIEDEQLVWDTELVQHIIDSSQKEYGLKKRVVAIDINYPTYEDIVGKRTKKQSKPRRTLDKWPIEIVARYNAMDCYATYKLFEAQSRALSAVGTAGTQYELVVPRYFTEIERPVSFILQNMESRGVRIDLTYLAKLKDRLERQKGPLEIEIKNELGNINLNSPKQLLEALNGKGITPFLKNKPSTDKRALDKMRHVPVVQNLLSFSEIETLLTSFVYPYLERGQEIVRPYFNQCGTRTGRLSCSNPNLLQIPKRTENGKLVRRMFIPRDGFLFGDCDFGQIEPRVLAHLSKDANMLQMFDVGTDFHDYTASRLNIDRERAKVLNLSVGYRATYKSVANQLKCSNREAQNEIDKWWSLYPTLRLWQDKLIYKSKSLGYCETIMGRRIKIDNLSDGNSWRREGAERQLINNITQGSAAEIMKKAMIAVDKLNLVAPLVQVYDELLFEFEEHQEVHGIMDQVKFAMETCCELVVPLVVDAKYGTNWAECH